MIGGREARAGEFEERIAALEEANRMLRAESPAFDAMQRQVLGAERRYRQVFDLSQRPMYIYGATSLRFFSVNHAMVQQYGYSEAELLAMTIRDIRPPEDVALLESTALLVRLGGPLYFTRRHRKKDGTIFLAEVSSHQVEWAGEEPARLVVATEFSDLVAAERELARLTRVQLMLSRCSQALVQAPDEDSLLHQICRIAVDVGGYCLAAVGFKPDDPSRPMLPAVVCGGGAEFLTLVSDRIREQFEGRDLPGHECIRTGSIVVSADLVQDPRFAEYGRIAAGFGIHSAAFVPLRANGRVFGLLAQYSSEIARFGSEELKMLGELADNVAFGITQFRQRARQRELESLLLQVASAVSDTAGTQFFEQLTLNMYKALKSMGVSGAFVSLFLPAEVMRARTTAAVVDGVIVDNFEYGVEHTPAEHLVSAQEYLLPDQLAELYPDLHAFSGRRPRSDAGRRLDDSAGEPLGTIFLIFDQPLDEAGFVLSVLRIFGARVAAELERGTHDARVREQASVIDRTNDAIILRTLDQRIVYWNRGAEKLYGWTYEEVVGKSVGDLLYAYPPVLEEINATVIELGEWSGQIAHRRKDGVLVTVESHWTLLRDKNGNPEAISSVATDISERLILEERLRHSQKMEAIGQLTGGLAHDFNNILTVIMGAAELLTDLVGPGGRANTLVNMTHQAASRGAELTHQMLAFSRRQALQPRVLSVSQLLDDLCRLLSGTISEDISVELVKAPDLGAALIDPGQLQSALLNLCLNSRDAMPHGGRITIESANISLDDSYIHLNPGIVSGDYIMIAITDTGFGIPAENLDRVFDPFFTTKEVGKGTGLGLSMVYGFVNQSRGHLKIYSEPDLGTSVKIYLPRVSESEPLDDPIEPFPEEVRGVETILIVEDDPLVLELAVTHLEALGYSVISASTGTEALDFLSQGIAIDLLFTDIVMPGGIHGRQLADQALQLRPDLKLLFTSGYTDNSIIHQGRLDPGVSLLNKPYRSKDLATKVRAVLDGDSQ